MEVQAINLKNDKKQKPKTDPQISPELYAVWLTKKYIKDVSFYKTKADTLLVKLNKLKEENEALKNSKASKRLKYMNEQEEFNRELAKEDIIKNYKEHIKELTNTIKRLRKDNSNLISKLNK